MKRLYKTFIEVVMAVAPMLAIILALLIPARGYSGRVLAELVFGAVFVIVGMTLFLFGAEFSMLAVGDLVGSYLMRRGKLAVALVMAFVIGTVITIAEPDVQVLAKQVAAVSGGEIQAPLLLICVGLGVGVFIAIAVATIIFRKNLILTLLGGYIIAFLVAVFLTPGAFVPVSFDAGGVTTGPITVPFIIAFATGVTGVIGNKKGGESFGMVGIASIGPILACLVLGVLYR